MPVYNDKYFWVPSDNCVYMVSDDLVDNCGNRFVMTHQLLRTPDKIFAPSIEYGSAQHMFLNNLSTITHL